MKWQWIIDLTPAELQNKMKTTLDFHTKPAPGAVIGVYMVEEGLKALGETKGVMNSVVESSQCLPDAISILTGCTIGNKYLWLRDSGRYALAFYDRDSKKGVRVSIDQTKLSTEKTPLLEAFFTKRGKFTIEDRKERQKKVIAEFLSLNFSIFKVNQIEVNLPTKPELKKANYCTSCTEYFKSLEEENCCLECSGCFNTYKK